MRGPALWAARLAWAAAGGAVYAGLVAGASSSFYIENTAEALARAEGGARQAELACAVQVGLSLLTPWLRIRSPRAAAWLVGAPAVLTVLLLQASGTLLGLLAAVVLAPVVLAGLLFGLVPARRSTVVGRDPRTG